MNSRELVCRTLLGAEKPRSPCGPLATHYTAALAGVSIRDYTMNAQVLADCVIRYYEKYQPDAVWVSADTWVTAEAMGAKVHFIDDVQPMCGTGEPLIKSAADVDRIPPAMPNVQGRMPLMWKALEKVKRRIGKDAFIVGCFDQSPFSLACALMGINNMMMNLLDDIPFIEALIQKCIEYCSAYGIYLAQTGADMLSTGDSAAGLIGEKMYSSIALPAEQKVFMEIRRSCDAFLSLHICGKTNHILKYMATAECDVLEIDFRTEIDEAIRNTNDRIGLWGNLDPVGVLCDSSAEIVYSKAAELLDKVHRTGRQRFVLSSGCTLAPETPEDNLRALIRAAKDMGISKTIV